MTANVPLLDSSSFEHDSDVELVGSKDEIVPSVWTTFSVEPPELYSQQKRTRSDRR